MPGRAIACCNRRSGAATLATALALMVAASVPAIAGATGNAIINDCESNGQLTHSYTLPELRHALAVMPPSDKEYSDCYDVVSRAELGAVARPGATGGSGSGSAGAFLPTPVVVILVALGLAAVTFGALAIRHRRADERDGPAP
jgi:hypothetical protein